VLLDPRQVALALAAVLRNAWQAMDGAGAIQATAGLVPARPHRPGSGPGPRPSRLRLAVRDRGPGFAPDQAGRLFEPFAGDRREPGRWGLGLALAQAVADLHGGSVRVEPAEGGTEVAILLPVQGDGPR
jgi:signal transduction histidine kinase